MKGGGGRCAHLKVIFLHSLHQFPRERLFSKGALDVALLLLKPSDSSGLEVLEIGHSAWRVTMMVTMGADTNRSDWQMRLGLKKQTHPTRLSGR